MRSCIMRVAPCRCQLLQWSNARAKPLTGGVKIGSKLEESSRAEKCGQPHNTSSWASLIHRSGRERNKCLVPRRSEQALDRRCSAITTQKPCVVCRLQTFQTSTDPHKMALMHKLRWEPQQSGQSTVTRRTIRMTGCLQRPHHLASCRSC
jgi:hypothetical protein